MLFELLSLFFLSSTCKHNHYTFSENLELILVCLRKVFCLYLFVTEVLLSIKLSRLFPKKRFSRKSFDISVNYFDEDFCFGGKASINVDSYQLKAIIQSLSVICSPSSVSKKFSFVSEVLKYFSKDCLVFERFVFQWNCPPKRAKIIQHIFKKSITCNKLWSLNVQV